jgi:hypothetical protein
MAMVRSARAAVAPEGRGRLEAGLRTLGGTVGHAAPSSPRPPPPSRSKRVKGLLSAKLLDAVEPVETQRRYRSERQWTIHAMTTEQLPLAAKAGWPRRWQYPRSVVDSGPLRLTSTSTSTSTRTRSRAEGGADSSSSSSKTAAAGDVVVGAQTSASRGHHARSTTQQLEPFGWAVPVAADDDDHHGLAEDAHIHVGRSVGAATLQHGARAPGSAVGLGPRVRLP